MKYQVLMNGLYMNTYTSYLQAKNEMEILQRRFPKSDIEIINVG